MTTKEMVYAALFAALIGVLGLIPPIPLGFIPVPVTAQTLGVMLAGCFLGKKTGTISVALFIVLTVLGIPMLSGGRGGLSVLMQPTAGYLLSWPVAVFCIGYFTEKAWPKLKAWKLIAINVVFGVLLISLIGAPVMALITHTPVWTGLVGATAFLPGDCIKAVVAAVIALQLKAISPIEDKLHRR
ncbi:MULTISPECIES: biotin transporter BioY [Paenibacillus]|uniref:Biotin transporter n=1 Tax=Paenibacillus albilobatus TaxID=2716884 RepID=A0A920C9F5_9BACL|nr:MULTISPECIES: biotin transporter BioY [Paenibacillus]GIO31045.1 biotin transporter BioY [Paenibacillus albilobatus]